MEQWKDETSKNISDFQIISSCLLALNFKILLEQVCRRDEVNKEDLSEIKNASGNG
jgi:hypothetical protein